VITSNLLQPVRNPDQHEWAPVPAKLLNSSRYFWHGRAHDLITIEVGTARSAPASLVLIAELFPPSQYYYSTQAKSYVTAPSAMAPAKPSSSAHKSKPRSKSSTSSTTAPSKRSVGARKPSSQSTRSNGANKITKPVKIKLHRKTWRMRFAKTVDGKNAWVAYYCTRLQRKGKCSSSPEIRNLMFTEPEGYEEDLKIYREQDINVETIFDGRGGESVEWSKRVFKRWAEKFVDPKQAGVTSEHIKSIGFDEWKTKSTSKVGATNVKPAKGHEEEEESEKDKSASDTPAQRSDTPAKRSKGLSRNNLAWTVFLCGKRVADKYHEHIGERLKRQDELTAAPGSDIVSAMTRYSNAGGTLMRTPQYLAWRKDHTSKDWKEKPMLSPLNCYGLPRLMNAEMRSKFKAIEKLQDRLIEIIKTHRRLVKEAENAS